MWNEVEMKFEAQHCAHTFWAHQQNNLSLRSAERSTKISKNLGWHRMSAILHHDLFLTHPLFLVLAFLNSIANWSKWSSDLPVGKRTCAWSMYAKVEMHEFDWILPSETRFFSLNGKWDIVYYIEIEVLSTHL